MEPLELNLNKSELIPYLIVPSLYNTNEDNIKLIKNLNKMKNVKFIKQLQTTKMISILANETDINLIKNWKEVLTITENTIQHV